MVLVALAGCQWSIGGQAAPDQEVLDQISLTAADAAAGAEFALVDHGDEVVGQTSLDLCYANYPSEDQRVARHQVQAFNAVAGAWVSSEAVAYTDPAAAEQAMDELAAAAADCHTTSGSSSADGQDVSLRAVRRASVPASRPAADDTLTWTFDPDPAADWPQTPGVNRQAYSFQIADQAGDSSAYVTTYLRRGRILLAVYVTPPDSARDVIVNSPTQQRLVEVMSARLASLPEVDVK